MQQSVPRSFATNGPTGPDTLWSRCISSWVWERGGKVLKSEPKRKRSGTHRYGFSANGQILLEEQYTEFPGQVYECFWEWTEGPSATLYDYHAPDKDCINVEQLFLADGVPRAYIRYAKMGVMVSTFEYEGSRVVRMQQHNRMHDPSLPPSYSFTRELLIRYSDDTLWEVDATYEDGSRTRILERGELL